MAITIQHKRGVVANRPTLAAGEFYWATDTSQLWVGPTPTLVNSSGSGGPPTGTGALWFTSSPPSGWLICDGSAVSRTTYATLFTILGTTFGAGDGSTTFNLPDFRQRVPVGLDASDSRFNAIAKTGGETDHTLTVAEMPSHTHTENAPTSASSGAVRFGTDTNASGNVDSTLVTGSTGGGGTHNNLQPFLVVNYIIKT